MKKVVYLIGALKNKNIPHVANRIEALGCECFSDWFAPGPEADSFLRQYSKARGRDYKQTLDSYAARQIFDFDLRHIERADLAVALFPIGRSGHLESGFFAGRGKPVFALFDKPPARFDLMHRFFTEVFFNEEELYVTLRSYLKNR